MAKLKGLATLNRKIATLKEAAGDVQSTLEEKREWWANQKDSWKEGEKGQEWDAHLNHVEEILGQIENLELASDD